MRVTNYTGIYTAVKNANLAKPKKHNNKAKKEAIVGYQQVKTPVTKADFKKLQEEQQLKMSQGFMGMAKEIVSDQATGYQNTLKQLLQNNKIGSKDIEQAKVNIAEQGYWGISKTSNRIIKFAKCISSSDPELAMKLKEGFIKGFEAAEKAWGGQLPSICYETKNAVLNEFNNWVE